MSYAELNSFICIYIGFFFFLIIILIKTYFLIFIFSIHLFLFNNIIIENF